MIKCLLVALCLALILALEKIKGQRPKGGKKHE